MSVITIGRSAFLEVKRLRARSRAIAGGVSGAGRRYGSEAPTSKTGDQQNGVLTFASATNADSHVGQPRSESVVAGDDVHNHPATSARGRP